MLHKENIYLEKKLNLLRKNLAFVSSECDTTVSAKSTACGFALLRRGKAFKTYPINVVCLPFIVPVALQSSVGNISRLINAFVFDKSTNTSLSHFYDKLLKLKDYMHTYTAKKLAEKRTAFLKTFLDEFYDEIK